ncbi:MAG: transcriptional repressor LexA [Candidatus Uhrbacteria bacterium]|nr:transcriptional repressor LexA [Candidatus Uhrbacteria bacterium]
MSNLTKKQNEVLAFIKKHLDDCGYAPSYREIGEHFRLSSSATVHGHIQSLVDKGMIRIGEEGEARSIELVPQAEPIHRGFRLSADVVNLPMMGLIAAGQPIEAINDNETMAVPASFVLDGANSYVLKIKGQSMIEDGILDGDFVVIERNPSPRNGEVVVALLDNAFATLKRFYREPSRIRLQPANKTMDPIYVQDCIIQGVVRAVIRKFQPV